MTRVFIIAGELSGDKLGAALMQGLAGLDDVTFQGIGGPLMQGQGMTSLFPMEELSLMGIAEILPQYFHLKRRIRETVQAVLDYNPDVLITIDSPDFCLRVAKAVKARSNIRTVHYVAPTVWAWRPKRAAKMAGFIDQILALFPFEPEYMKREGIECEFVGHPVVDDPIASEADIATFRAQHGLADKPILLVLPGSRKGEIKRLLPIFKPAVEDFVRAHPNIQVVIPAAPSVAEDVVTQCSNWKGAPLVLDPRELSDFDRHKCAAFKGASLALAASGTVSLELAANDTPMVIAYDMNRISRMILKRMLLTDTVTLINLVSDTRVVPEYIGEDCTADAIRSGLEQVLTNPYPQYDAMRLTMERLGQGGDPPGLRAAKAVLDGIKGAR